MQCALPWSPELRADTFSGTMENGLSQVAQTVHSVFSFRLLVGKMKVEQHEDTGLGIHAQQRDEPDPHPDAHVVAEHVEEPDGTHGRERHSENNESGFHEGARVEVKEQ